MKNSNSQTIRPPPWVEYIAMSYSSKQDETPETMKKRTARLNEAEHRPLVNNRKL